MDTFLQEKYKKDIDKISLLLSFSNMDIEAKELYILIKNRLVASSIGEYIVPLISKDYFIKDYENSFLKLINVIQEDILQTDKHGQIVIIINSNNKNTLWLKQIFKIPITIQCYISLKEKILNRNSIRAYYSKLSDNLIDKQENIYPIISSHFTRSGEEKTIQNTQNKIIETINDFVTDNENNSCFLSILGSYGSGKSVLLNNIAKYFLNNEELNFFPILVDFKGLTTIEDVVDRHINYIYKVYLKKPLDNFHKCFSDITNIIFLFDSFDEQRNFNEDIIESYIKHLNRFIRKYKAKVIFASRPEIFTDWKRMLLTSKKLRAHTKNVFYLEYLGLNSNSFSNLIKHANINIQENTVAFDFLSKFIKKPIWYKYTSKFINKTNSKLKNSFLIELAEYCIQKWQERENKTNRHHLLSSLRLTLNKLASIKLFASIGSRVPKRSEFINFIKSLINDSNIIEEKNIGLLNIRDYLPPEATAQSLIVSNLITLDKENKIDLENIFYFYFLSKIFKEILQDSKIEDIGLNIISINFNINNVKELLSSYEISDSNIFKIFLRNEFNNLNLKSLACEYLEFFKPNASKIIVKDFAQILANYEDVKAEEKRVYELKPPSYWQSPNNYFYAKNIIYLLSILYQNKISGINIDFCILKNVEITNTKFIECSFIGSHFSYCCLKNVTFHNCIFEYSLFEFCNIDESTYESLGEYKGILFIGKNDSETCKAQNFLNSIKSDEEEWIFGTKDINILENSHTSIKVPIFLTKKNPTTNEEILNFIASNHTYELSYFRKHIENKYYLQYIKNFREKTVELGKLKDFKSKPVTYISLLTAFAYCVSKGCRLPSAAESILIRKKSKESNNNSTQAIDEYWDIPTVTPNNFYPPNLLVEMTYQVDSIDHWNLLSQSSSDKSLLINPLPFFNRKEKIRCEYIIIGKETFYGKDENDTKYKTSKLATWLNPDQTFRCVFDYTQKIYHVLKCSRKF